MAAPSIGARRRPTVLVVGAASRDLDQTDARGWRLGGGVTYGSMAAVRLRAAEVRALIGVDAEAAHAAELDVLRGAGVSVALAPIARGPVFDNQSTAAGRRQVAHEVSDRIAVDALPAGWRAPDAAILAPVAGELADDWAGLFDVECLVGLGWQGLLRRLEPGQSVEGLPLRPQPLTARADFAVVSAEDIVAGGAALSQVLGRPGQRVLVTHGPRPALLVTRRVDGCSLRLLPVKASGTVVDETGAGDVLLASWAVSLAALRRAGSATGERGGPERVAIAAAGLKVEAASLLEMAGLREICERIITPPGRSTSR